MIPPIETAKAGGAECPARDRTVVQVQKLGRRQWKKECGYHRQGRVENAFLRHRKVVGGKLRARVRAARKSRLGSPGNLLNRMFELGRPVSVEAKS